MKSIRIAQVLVSSKKHGQAVDIGTLYYSKEGYDDFYVGRERLIRT